MGNVYTFTTAVSASLAIIGTLFAACAVERMNRRTDHAVRFSVILIGVGMLGQFSGIMGWGWSREMDSTLYGGIAAYLLACRRVRLGDPLGLSRTTMRHLSMGLSAATWLFFLYALFK